MKSSRYEAIFFDAGGTLLYPYPSPGEIYAEVARHHGLYTPSDRMENAFRAAWAECHLAEPAGQSSQAAAVDFWRHIVFKSLDFLGEDVNDREAYFQELYELFARPEVWRLFPDTEEVLAALSARGCKIGLISNWDNRLRPLLNGLGIAPYFQSISISAEVGSEKPDPAIFEHALKTLGVEAAKSLHVGDSHRDDVLGAQRVGINSALLSRNGKVDGYGGFTIHSLRELL